MILVLAVLIFVGTGHGFPTDVQTGWENVYTKTHRDIYFAIHQAIATFLEENGYLENGMKSVSPVSTIHGFFGNDTDRKEMYYKTYGDIFTSLQEQEKSDEPHLHCNGEEILEAHNHLLRIRKNMKDIAETTNPDISVLTSFIGHGLYTIQNFYSSTNWVEINGKVPYADFGVPNRTLMPIAVNDVDTCRDCTGDECKNNLLVSDVLTSGYLTGQTAALKPKSTFATTGKCGYGGQLDSKNGEKTARGGINKDSRNSALSPHNHLHDEAFYAARSATISFLINDDYGIINELTNETFAKIFHLNKRNVGSLGLAIDVTGSMSNDIVQVQKACIDIVTNIRGTANEPINYVLTTFSDPESLTKLVLKTQDGLEISTSIKNLKVSGGADCPEYAMSGLLKAVQESERYSTIFLFTDADAKDDTNYQDVIDLAVSKNITLEVLLTNSCGDSSGLKRKKRSNVYSSSYFRVTEATNGNVYTITSSEIGSVMQKVLEKRFPSSTALVKEASLNVDDDNFVQFNIDSFVYNMKITIIGPTAASEVNLLYKDVSLSEGGGATTLYENPNTVIISVIEPMSGIYTIERKMRRYWELNVTAQTDVDFEYEIQEKHDNSIFYRIAGNPILGKLYRLRIQVIGLSENASGEIILSRGNNKEESLNTTQQTSESVIVLYAYVTFQTNEDHVVRTCVTYDGEVNITRTSGVKITPVSVQLNISYISEIFKDTEAKIPFSVAHFGSQAESLIVNVASSDGSITNSSTKIEVPPGRSVTGSFGVKGSSYSKTITFSLAVQLDNSSTIFQQQTKALFISSDIPPQCTLLYTEGNCSSALYNGKCSSTKWSSLAKVTYDDEVTHIKSTSGLTIYHNDTISPLYMNISGNCCVLSGYITIIDVNNIMTRCNINMGDNVYLEESETENLTDSVKIATGVIVVGVFLFIFVSVNISFIIYRTGMQSGSTDSKLNDFITEVSTIQDKITSYEQR